jgi:hypothetical protein
MEWWNGKRYGLDEHQLIKAARATASPSPFPAALRQGTSRSSLERGCPSINPNDYKIS